MHSKTNYRIETLKKALKIVIKIFDPKKEVTLTTDGIEHAVAAIKSKKVTQ